jgi:hypothetical protein
MAEGFIKCARARWELPPVAVAGIWGIFFIVYGAIMINVNKRANKSLKSSLTLGLVFGLLTLPIYYFSARLAALWVPIVILVAFDTHKKLYQAGLKVQCNLISVYIAWLFYILIITGFVAIKCPPVDLSYIEEEVQLQAQEKPEKILY